jgi:hypothetical protein
MACFICRQASCPPTRIYKGRSSNNGIVWAYEQNNGQAILHAYDATNLQTELFNSGTIGGAVKFAVPTVCNGKVFVGTSSSIAAFGQSPGIPSLSKKVAKSI